MIEKQTIKVKYTGPLAECGFRGPVTGQQYMAHGNEPFEVAAEDWPKLVKRHSAVLVEVVDQPSRRRKSAMAEVNEPEPVEVEETDGTE